MTVGYTRVRPPHKDEEGLPKRRPSTRSPAEPDVRHAVPVTCGTGDASASDHTRAAVFASWCSLPLTRRGRHATNSSNRTP
jgi:hypothetical protein